MKWTDHLGSPVAAPLHSRESAAARMLSDSDEARPSVAMRSASLSIPGLTAEYVRLPSGREPSTTCGHAIGVAFTPQRRAVWHVGRSRRRVAPLPPGAVFVVPAEGLEWDEWSDVSESVEMWIDPPLLDELSSRSGGPPRVTFDYHEAANDPVVVSAASLVRQSLLSGSPAAARLESLPLLLAAHVLERYRGLRVRRTGRTHTLGRAVLARVTEYIDAHLERPLSVLALARVAGQSPWHFAKAFRATTGAPPHAYITARRMERALVLLQQTTLPVRRVARLVGFESLSHFRASFRRAWGESTAVYRRTGRPPRRGR